MEKMNLNKFWEYFAYGYLIVNTICAIILIEIIITGNTNGSLFLLLFGFTAYFNFTIFKKKKE